MSNVSTWSPLASNNTGSAPDFLSEGVAPSAVNDAFRELQAAMRRQLEDGQWFNWGLTHTRLTSSDFSVAGDYRTLYEVGRRVKMEGSSTTYGTVSAVSYTAPNTTVTIRENNVPSTLSAVSPSILSKTNYALPEATYVVTAGTAGAPSVVFPGDLDTGIYQQAANVIGFSAGGTETLNVGAGFLRLVNQTTQTTAPVAGGAAALPATPAGYLAITINGNTRYLPFY